MPKGSIQSGGSVARESVWRQVENLLEPRDAEPLRDRIREDDGRFSLSVEITILLSASLALVASGLAVVIKNQQLDLRFPFTLLLAVAGLVLVARAAQRLDPARSDEAADLPLHVQLMLGVALLVGFVGAVQFFYTWSSLTSLAAAAAFLALAQRCNSKAALTSSLGMLAAFLGVQTVPNNWTVFRIVEKTSAAWSFVLIGVGLAVLLYRLREKNDFSLVCLSAAVPVALVTVNLDIAEAVDKQNLAAAVLPLVVVLTTTALVLWASSRWRMVLLSVTAIANAVFGLMAFILILLDNLFGSSDTTNTFFFLILFVVALSAMFLATRIVRRDSSRDTAT